MDRAPGPRFIVVLVRPKYAGNIGSTARAMHNFGLAELWLVDPCPVDEHGRKMAMHAWHVLDQARTFPTLDAALAEVDLAVGTASDLVANEKRDYLRMPLAVRDFGDRAQEMKGTIALLFGPEDFGLTNEDLEKCEVLVTIPASSAHPSLNLSHAVAVVCYELMQHRHRVKRAKQASREEVEVMMGFVARILDHMQLPDHRRLTTMRSFRRMLGRAMMSKWEYHRVMGVLNGAVRAMEELERQGKRVRALRRVERKAKGRAATGESASDAQPAPRSGQAPPGRS